MQHFYQASVGMLFLLLFAGCSAPPSVTIVERGQPPPEKITTHWVASGETLYAIAWRYNLSVDALAKANGLNSRDTLSVGRVLSLDVKKASDGHLAKRSVAIQESLSSARSKNSTKTGSPLAAWRWPLGGKLVKRFNFKADRGYKGLAIDGRVGEAVHATQNGEVVYAGSGLPAYGKMLIVKHGDKYLSAYAHNSRLLVKEGDRVKAGQKIAEVGETGTSYAHLYFEIRKRGVPVDPLKLLPKRRV